MFKKILARFRICRKVQIICCVVVASKSFWWRVVSNEKSSCGKILIFEERRWKVLYFYYYQREDLYYGRGNIKCFLLIFHLFIFFPFGEEKFSSVDIFVVCGNFHRAWHIFYSLYLESAFESHENPRDKNTVIFVPAATSFINWRSWR